jgi:hypothetical protein
MIDELSKKYFVIPLNLRDGNYGDFFLNYIYSHSAEVEKGILHLIPLFTTGSRSRNSMHEKRITASPPSLQLCSRRFIK